MLYGLKNDGGIELHLSKAERKLFYLALIEYYEDPCKNECEFEDLYVDNILRILHFPESVEEIEELNKLLKKMDGERMALLHEVQRLKNDLNRALDESGKAALLHEVQQLKKERDHALSLAERYEEELTYRKWADEGELE